jgi:xanthine dehydrogenase YagR molybdenum-binding subunit
VVVKLGDSAFPSPGSGGQWGANSLDRRRLRGLRQAARGGRAGARLDPDVVVRKRARCKCRQPERSAWQRGAAGGELVAEDAWNMAILAKRYQQSTFGAHFVEVAVDAARRDRVRRMLAVCAAGRILNPKAARSQVIGGMTMGVGAALMEELVVDKRSASSSTTTWPATKCRSMPTFRTRR